MSELKDGTIKNADKTREVERMCAADGYFFARPQIDNADSRKVFEEAFDRGYLSSALQTEKPIMKDFETIDVNEIVRLRRIEHAAYALIEWFDEGISVAPTWIEVSNLREALQGD